MIPVWNTLPIKLKTKNIVLETANQDQKFLERMEREIDQPEYGENVGEIIVSNESISSLFPLCLACFVFF